MNIRMLQNLSTTEAVYLAGQIYSLSEDRANRWIASHLAEAATPPTPPVETMIANVSTMKADNASKSRRQKPAKQEAI